MVVEKWRNSEVNVAKIVTGEMFNCCTIGSRRPVVSGVDGRFWSILIKTRFH